MQTLTAAINEDANKLAFARIQRQAQVLEQGGGKAKVARQHAKGKMTARERVVALVDPGAAVREIGVFAGAGMYAEHGGCPAGGVVVVMAPVCGRTCVIVANDATVKAGAWFPITGKKNLRAQEIAMENRLPIIYLVDSAGVYLPLQDEIFADKEHFGRMFRNNARLSSMGVPQIAAIMGSCVAGGAYLPIMSDESLIVEGTGSIFLAGPYLVRAAVGEDVDQETLGGATTHTSISGVVDYKCADDATCLATIRDLVDKLGERPRAGLNRSASAKPAVPVESIYGRFPDARNKPYPTLGIIECIVDADTWTEYKADYGRTMLCGYARVDGWSVGIVANNREIVRTATGEMQFGGVIYSDSADKAARFVMNCNQKRIPLLFLHDVTGFMVGSRSEHGGIIKDGAKLVNAVSNSTVPKITVVMGNSYGAGNYAMCGKAYDPRFIAAWPTARIAVMGGSQAAKVLLQIEMASAREELSEEEQAAMLDRIAARYDAQTEPIYAAARLWVDEIIDPAETRAYVSQCIEAADHGVIEPFNVGVIQT